MSSKIYKYLGFILLLPIFVVLPGCKFLYQSNKSLKKASLNSGNNIASDKKKQVEFELTKEEIAEMGKWKHRSMEELTSDAFNGDRGALYMLGIGYLCGTNGAIDVEKANQFFSMSASLGFGPSLNQLRAISIENQNPWLGLVYANLVVSSGHKEFVVGYHLLRDKLLKTKKYRRKIAQIIEEISATKKKLIQKNQRGLKKAADKRQFFLGEMKNITMDDSCFDNDFWKSIWEYISFLDHMGITEIEKLDMLQMMIGVEIIKTLIDSKKDSGNKISDLDIKAYIKERLQNLLQTEDGRRKAIGEAKSLLKIAEINQAAINQIIEENGNVPPYDLKEQVKERTDQRINNIVCEFKSLLR